MANREALRSVFDDGTELEVDTLDQSSQAGTTEQTLCPAQETQTEKSRASKRSTKREEARQEVRKTGIYLPIDLFREVKIFCIEEDTSLTKLVVELLHRHLERQQRKKGKD